VNDVKLNITSIDRPGSEHYSGLVSKGLSEIINSRVVGKPYRAEQLTKTWPNGKAMTYILNSKGYRGDELSKSTELVFSGCSYTYATGLEDQYIWGNILADSLGMSRSNLGKEGWSTQAIVKNLFSYFEEYGNPKILVCLFPDLQRMMAALNPYVLRGFSRSDARFEDKSEHEQTFCHTHLREYDISLRPKYSKMPYAWEDVIPIEMPIMTSFHYLHMLIQYCKAADIKFYWSTWNYDFSDLLDQVLKYPDPLMDMSGYIHLEREIWEADPMLDCHLEDRAKNLETFDWSLDHGGGHWGHNGQHSHMHTAEAFLARIKES
jgi:hypothetical protein